MTDDCAWRPRRNRPAQTWHPLYTHSTLGRPKMPFARSHQGWRVHRIRYWWLLWDREDGVVKFRSASAYMWCGQGMGTRGYTIAADVRMVADDASALCPKCFPCEIADEVFVTGGLDSQRIGDDRSTKAPVPAWPYSEAVSGKVLITEASVQP